MKVFHLVSNKFAIYQTFPQIPGEFLDVKHINGLGHVFNIVDYSHPRTYYYIPEDAYEWLGRPKKMTAGKFTWPKLPGFVFLGGQEIHSEGEVHIHVDGADGSSPALSMHEQDTDNLNWVRFAPWNGRAKMLSTCDESFIVSDVLSLVLTAGPPPQGRLCHHSLSPPYHSRPPPLFR